MTAHKSLDHRAVARGLHPAPILLLRLCMSRIAETTSFLQFPGKAGHFQTSSRSGASPCAWNQERGSDRYRARPWGLHKEDGHCA